MNQFAWLLDHKANVYSQFGEDGVLGALFDNVKPASRWCVEVGAADGTWCSNTRRLIEQGWSALLIERDDAMFERLAALHADNPRVVCLHRAVSVEGPDTLDALMDEAGVPENPDLLVLDIDGPDYYVFNSLLRHRPRVLLCEAGNAVAPDHIPSMEQCSETNQAGWLAVARLGESKGYELAATVGLNLLFVSRSICDYLRPQVPAPPEGEPIRLNLGSGPVGLEGYVNLDIKRGEAAYPLTQYADGSVVEVRASHILEHYPYGQAQDVLREWARVLCDGGVLKLAVPDLEKISRWYLGGMDLNVLGYLYGGHVDEDDYHKAAFDATLLRLMLEEAGLVAVQPWQSEAQDCAALPISLNLMGYKGTAPVGAGAEPEVEEERVEIDAARFSREVKGAMTAPRLGFMDNQMCALQAFIPLGIEMRQSRGVFWGQCLTRVIEDVIAIDGCKYVLTLDYDTVFTREDVLRLYAMMEAHPEVDALAAMQMRRNMRSPLLTFGPVEGGQAQEVAVDVETLSSPLMQARTAHFGLTMFRASAFADLPKPWFLAKPDGEGRWGDEKCDEDIHFWLQWEKAGKSLYIANRVVVGHMELMVTWPSMALSPLFQYTQDYHSTGRPPEGVWI